VRELWQANTKTRSRSFCHFISRDLLKLTSLQYANIKRSMESTDSGELMGLYQAKKGMEADAPYTIVLDFPPSSAMYRNALLGGAALAGALTVGGVVTQTMKAIRKSRGSTAPQAPLSSYESLPSVESVVAKPEDIQQATVSDLEVAIRSKQEELSRVRAAELELKKQIEVYNSELRQKTRELDEVIPAAISQQKGILSGLEREVESQKEAVAMTASQLRQTEIKLKETQDKVARENNVLLSIRNQVELPSDDDDLSQWAQDLRDDYEKIPTVTVTPKKRNPRGPVSKILSELKESSNDLDELRAERQEKTQARDKLGRQNLVESDARQEQELKIQELEAQIVNLTQRIEDKERQLDRLRATFEQNHEELRNESIQLEDEINSKKAQLQEAHLAEEQHLLQIQQQIEEQQAKLTAAKNVQLRFAEDMRQLDKEIEARRSEEEIETRRYEESITQLNTQIEQATAQLSAADARRKGVIESQADIMRQVASEEAKLATLTESNKRLANERRQMEVKVQTQESELRAELATKEQMLVEEKVKLEQQKTVVKEQLRGINPQLETINDVAGYVTQFKEERDRLDQEKQARESQLKDILGQIEGMNSFNDIIARIKKIQRENQANLQYKERIETALDGKTLEQLKDEKDGAESDFQEATEAFAKVLRYVGANNEEEFTNLIDFYKGQDRTIQSILGDLEVADLAGILTKYKEQARIIESKLQAVSNDALGSMLDRYKTNSDSLRKLRAITGINKDSDLTAGRKQLLETLRDMAIVSQDGLQTILEERKEITDEYGLNAFGALLAPAGRQTIGRYIKSLQ
jgi:chromosome segregation ATPase